MIRGIEIALVASLWLAACTQPVAVDTSCSAFRPITYSASGDTEDTKRQIREHNAVWVRLCKVGLL